MLTGGMATDFMKAHTLKLNMKFQAVIWSDSVTKQHPSLCKLAMSYCFS